MTRVKSGFHYIPTHGRPEDVQAVIENPSAIEKVVYSSTPDANHLRNLLDKTDKLWDVRDHAKSEQHDDVWRDPEGTGERHAQEWYDTFRAIGVDLDRVVPEGVNEFAHWKTGGIDAQVRYELAFGRKAVSLGMQSLHFEFPVGWPGNGGIADAPPNWEPWMPVLEFIDAHPGRYAGLHEYWGFNKGVHFYEGWWFLRYRKMPYKVPMILNEIGGLKAYQNPDGTWGLEAQNGYLGDIPAGEAQLQMQEAEQELRKDNEIVGASWFSLDGAKPWIDECDVHPVALSYVAWAQQQPEIQPAQPEPPVQVLVPNVTMDGPQFSTGDEELDEPEPAQYMTYQAIDPRVLMAILQVESGGRPFGDDGRPTIRIELAWLRDNIPNRDIFSTVFLVDDVNGWAKPQYYREPGGQWIQLHLGDQRLEYRALELAAQMDEELAYRALNISNDSSPDLAYQSLGMGIGQTMGFNYARLGYPSAKAMWLAYHNEAAQVIGAINYVLSDSDLVEAVRAHDWRTIARLYNGNAVDVYAPQLEAAYEEIIS